MCRVKIPRTFKIKIETSQPVKTNLRSYISFFTGSLLAISESMPFIDNEYNGVLHALSKIRQEYKNDFK
jgi:hypothetical protein